MPADLEDSQYDKVPNPCEKIIQDCIMDRFKQFLDSNLILFTKSENDLHVTIEVAVTLYKGSEHEVFLAARHYFRCC